MSRWPSGLTELAPIDGPAKPPFTTGQKRLKAAVKIAPCLYCSRPGLITFSGSFHGAYVYEAMALTDWQRRCLTRLVSARSRARFITRVCPNACAHGVTAADDEEHGAHFKRIIAADQVAAAVIAGCRFRGRAAFTATCLEFMQALRALCDTTACC